MNAHTSRHRAARTRSAVRAAIAATVTLCLAAGCGAAGEVGGERAAAEARSIASTGGSGTSGEVACPGASCAGLASGSYDILSCHGGAMLVRCTAGRPRCFACKSGYSCRFNNGGDLAHDFCSPDSVSEERCTACNATARVTGAIWGCEERESRLVRCVDGCLQTKACAEGCTYNNGGTGQNDRCGKAAAGGGMIWPVNGAFTVTQHYACGSCSWYAWNAAAGCCLHDALDLAAPAYTSIIAAAAGTVIAAGWGAVEGYYVILDHGEGLTTYYGHMAAQPPVVWGQWVARGEHIGPMGATGLATGPHTHFMVRRHGAAQNPLSYLPPL